MVALENRFLKTRSGNIYSTTVCDYNFWKRYLQVFDEVLVLARVEEIQETELDKAPANGPNVSFLSLPYFIGPWGYLKRYRRLKSLVKQSITAADVFILRIPGTIASTLWHYLKTKRIPYGVEVVGDPWDSLSPGSVRTILRPLIRRKTSKDTTLQCRLASAASYVTKYSLQKRYPPNCWTTHYSSIELQDSAFIDTPTLEKRIEKIKVLSMQNAPWRICYVGMMEHLYKAPDVLIDAVAVCIKKGMNIELLMVGEGRFKSQLQEKVKALGITEKVTFLGKLTPGKPVYDVLDKADLYVLPSRQEGLPKTIIEAMARGLPCIASNVGGIPELLPDEAMVEPRDVTGLAEKIMSLIGNPEKLRQMAVRNLEKAREYRSRELNKRRVEFYKKVAEATKAYSVS
jgi:glycosyltransferase involved in cell wall biosynthesis